MDLPQGLAKSGVLSKIISTERAAFVRIWSEYIVNSKSTVNGAVVWLAILKRIPRNSWVTTQQLLESMQEAGYNLSERKIQRILKEMVDSAEFGIETNKKAKPYGYRLRLPEGSLPIYQMKPNESLLIRLFEEHLRFQLPERIRSCLRPVFESARSTLKEKASGRAKEWSSKVAFVPSTVPMLPPNIKNSVFTAVSNALYRDAKLEVQYENSKAETIRGLVSPLGLVQQEHRLYLICRFDGYDDVRHLALHRIKSAAECENFPAERPEGFSLQRYIAERHLNFSNGKKVLLEIEFTNPITAKNMLETPFTKDQKLEQLDDGAWRLQAEVDDTVILDGWLATWKDVAGIRRVVKTEVNVK